MDQKELLQSLIQAGLNSILSTPPSRAATPTPQPPPVHSSADPIATPPTPPPAHTEYSRPSKASISISNPNLHNLNHPFAPYPFAPYPPNPAPEPSAPSASRSCYVQTSPINSPQIIKKNQTLNIDLKPFKALFDKIQNTSNENTDIILEHQKLINENIQKTQKQFSAKQVKFEASIKTINSRINNISHTNSNNSNNCQFSIILFFLLIILWLTAWNLYHHLK